MELVSAEDAGITLAAWLRRHHPASGSPLSWSAARALAASGEVRVDGAIEHDSAIRLIGGQRVAVGRTEGPGDRGGPSRAASRRPASLRYLDRDIAVACKPAGLLTMPFEGAADPDTFVSRLQIEIRRRERAGSTESSGSSRRRTGSGALRVVQRLDKETSGLLVFARNVPAQRALQSALAEREIERTYWAIVEGTWPEGLTRRLESWLLDDRGDGRRGSWRPRPGQAAPDGARHAATNVLGLRTMGARSLVECRLETGRTHQIRIHLSEAGHAVVGDAVYGYRRTHRRGAPDADQSAPMLLHAHRLELAHPRTGERLVFEEPPPAEWGSFLGGRAKVALGGAEEPLSSRVRPAPRRTGPGGANRRSANAPRSRPR